MTPLPAALGGDRLVAWRLDRLEFAVTWDSGEGAFQFGGRWNSAGVRAVYAALDPSTAIVEVAVHKGFRVLDTVPHILTALEVLDAKDVFVVTPADIPNPNWLRPTFPSAGQQAFGDELVSLHKFVVLPSAVSTHSWNLVFNPAMAAGAYTLNLQERFALDPRLHPPSTR
ncbi:MAG: RES domain-containing protein [Rhizobiaceae bacterium]|nr:RES domain-containing protein [Rhizobiaceae bacterium]